MSSAVRSDDHDQYDRLSSRPPPPKGGWRAAIFIIFVEMSERFAYYGIAANLIIYLTTVLGQEVATAAKNVNNWNGVLAIALVVGAFLADSFLGRFTTTLVSTSIFFLGLIAITISASSIVSDSARKTVFFIALYVIAIGDGGHRPCLQTFAADQFDEETEEDKKAKSSFFNWWFLGISIGATSAVVGVVYIEDNVGWTAGYAILAGVEAAALGIFLAGFLTYRTQRPVGSPFTKVVQVIVAAVRKRGMKEGGVQDWSLCCEEDGKSISGAKGNDEHLVATRQFRWLDKAMIMDDQDASNKPRNPWRLCSLTQVEEVKLLLRLLPVWVCCLTYAIIVAQVHTFFIKQASTLNRSIGPNFKVPPAALQAVPGVIILTCIPLYDKLLVPATRKLTGVPSGLTSIQRIGIGLALSVITISIAALVETKRVSVAAEYGLTDEPKAVVPMSVWWLVPQFAVMGLSDLFAYVGMQELFYDQMPEDMRSMGSALTNGAIGVGSFMSTAVIAIVQEVSLKMGDEWLVNNLNRAHLDYFYWVLAGMCILDLLFYALVAKWFVWKKVET